VSLNRDQFVVVLADLRTRFRDGEWVDGQPLTVGDLAHHYGVSATPIREALSRLAGEGLVEDRRGRGYFARRIDGVELSGLYRAQAALALAGLGGAERYGFALPALSLTVEDIRADPGGSWEKAFEAMVRAAENPMLLEAQQRIADRLAPAWIVEAEIVDDPPGELDALLAGLATADPTHTRDALAPLMARRLAAVDRLASRLRMGRSKYKASI
jgi:DNA-binding FadR family transcriptional regulator